VIDVDLSPASRGDPAPVAGHLASNPLALELWARLVVRLLLVVALEDYVPDLRPIPWRIWVFELPDLPFSISVVMRWIVSGGLRDGALASLAGDVLLVEQVLLSTRTDQVQRRSCWDHAVLLLDVVLSAGAVPQPPAELAVLALESRVAGGVRVVNAECEVAGFTLIFVELDG
jgi:hypothetical protein